MNDPGKIALDGHTQLELFDTTDAPDGFLDEWPEGAEFYRATQSAAIPGFRFGYLIAYRSNCREAVVPYFITSFRLNTMLDNGLLKRTLGRFSIRIACIGHPTAGLGHIDGIVSAELLEKSFQVLSAKAPLVAFKGFASNLPVRGFTRAQGLPIAVLHLADDFWDSFHSSKVRNDIRRKLKSANALRWEEHEGLPPEQLESVYRLYTNTHDKAPVQFERLSPEYFSRTSALSTYILAFLENQMVGFAQLLTKGDRANVKYVGLDYSVSREYRTYFALFLRAMEVCRRRGIKEIEYGETSYAFKKELGCELIDNWIYYRHRNLFLNALLAPLAILLKPSENELH